MVYACLLYAIYLLGSGPDLHEKEDRKKKKKGKEKKRRATI